MTNRKNKTCILNILKSLFYLMLCGLVIGAVCKLYVCNQLTLIEMVVMTTILVCGCLVLLYITWKSPHL